MTGGGVYPAIAVLQALKNSVSDVLWIGSQSGMEETLLKEYKVAYQLIPAAGLHGVGFKALPNNLEQLLRGWRKAQAIISRFKPDAMFLTGGYLGVPVALAGRHIPSVAFVPDIEPGLALKVINRLADRIAVCCHQSLQYLPQNRTIVSGYPIREELKRWNRSNSRDFFKFAETDRVLLVFGGSKGARSINHALIKILPRLLEKLHVIHISGEDHWNEAQLTKKDLPQNLANRYQPFAFLHDEMGAALAAADLAVCRAGASTLGELPFFGLPAILVPYPHAWRYQQNNASFLAQHGGARIIKDDELQNKLETTIWELFGSTDTLQQMHISMQKLSKPDAANRIGELILSLGSHIEGGKAW